MEKYYKNLYNNLSSNDYLQIGDNIRAFRNKHDLSQMELAEKMGIDFRMVSRHETRGRMKLETLFKYADCFGVPLEDLLPDRLRNSACNDERLQPFHRLITEKLGEKVGIISIDKLGYIYRLVESALDYPV